MVALHLVKNSEDSSSGVNGKDFFGSPDWKIPGKRGTAQKVVPFSRLERPDWFLAFQLHLPVFFTSSRPTAIKLSPPFRKQNGGRECYDVPVSETDLITSEFDINQTNAKTWHWTGIGGLPKRFPCGILPVAATSLHKISNVPLVIGCLENDDLENEDLRLRKRRPRKR